MGRRRSHIRSHILNGVKPCIRTSVVPGAVWAEATGINERGQVLGIYDDGESVSSFLAIPGLSRK